MKQIPSAIYLVPALPLLMIVSGVLFLVMAPRSASNAEALQSDPPNATLSHQVAIIATVNAAPIRPRVPAASGPSEGLALLGVDPARVTAGETDFASVCAACHGPDARGLPNLGKDLVTSEFVASTSNDELLAFINTGRPIWDPANTSGVDMPAKGGNPALTDEEIVNIIYYLRSLDSDYMPSEADVAALNPESASESDTVQPVSTPQTAPQVSVAENQSEGAALFVASCSSCHGMDGRGLPNLGKDLVTSEFIASTSDDELLAFIITGRPIWDPANTTGIAMPPRGDNPTLSDEDIQTIIEYLRSIAE